MKKFFTLIAAALFGMSVSAQTWDFTVIPTQTVDGTGNLRSAVGDHINDDGGESWSAYFNAGGVKDEEQFTVKAGELFEQTKGLTFGILDNDKMVLYRNYPTNYGGCHLYFNKDVDLTIPAKKGQTIEFVLTSAKANKVCTSMSIAESGIEVPKSNGNSDITGYAPVTCTVTEDNPIFTMKSAVYVQKITVSGGSEPVAEEKLLATLDATTNTGGNDGAKWNFADGYTITNELGNRNYSDDGKYMTIGKVTATAARFHKINVPADVTVTAIEVEGYVNNGEGYSYLWKINDTEYDVFGEDGTDIVVNKAAKYGFTHFRDEKDGSGNQMVDTHKIAIENPTAGGSLNIGFTGTNAVRVLFRLYSGGTTGIETVKTVRINPANNVMYNLAGQKVDSNYKGIVIKNGVKYLNK